jgi:acyl carrier protein
MSVPAEGPAIPLDEIRRHLAMSLGADPDGLADDEPLLGGRLDSIALLTLSARLEESYGIAIGAHEVDPENFGTLGSLARFVTRKTAAR